MTTIEIYDDSAGEWRWRLCSSNGRIMADSAEGYASKYGAKRAARRFLAVAWDAKVVEVD